MDLLEGQMSIFDFCESQVSSFSWDGDINAIHEKISNLAEMHNIQISRSEWDIWGHVPQYGYRMSITLDVAGSQLTDSLWQGLNNIVEYAKSRQVELSLMSPVFLGDERGWMHIFSMFLDRERQKMKERGKRI